MRNFKLGLSPRAPHARARLSGGPFDNSYVDLVVGTQTFSNRENPFPYVLAGV